MTSIYQAIWSIHDCFLYTVVYKSSNSSTDFLISGMLNKNNYTILIGIRLSFEILSLRAVTNLLLYLEVIVNVFCP